MNTCKRFAHLPCIACTALTGLFDGDVDVEKDLDGIGEERSPPIDDKHDATAEHRANQRQPHVVESVCRAPAYGADNTKNVKQTSYLMDSLSCTLQALSNKTDREIPDKNVHVPVNSKANT